ncbi:MAG TPA: DUF6088 family protein [Nitrosomonas sp.]|nr:DUF6088 family protein [Nitrosomonas sp.]HNC42422.1 DUF6088 family protein [Nitrosomonas sp.]
MAAKSVQSIASKLLSRIHGHGRGWAFSANDFVVEFNSKNLDQALSQLVKDSKIRRVFRGLYDYPRYSELLQQELSPDCDQVAHALARKFNWRIQPSGEAALNLLGLTTQVPAKYIYHSDGPNRQYKIGKYTLAFKNTSLKNIGFKYRESGLIVQALKALGKDHIDEDIIASIRQQLTPAIQSRLLKDTTTVTDWVYNHIKSICRGED